MQIEEILGGRKLSKRDAIMANAELAKIRERYGRVTPALFVRWAQPVRNPLHRFLPWNDAAAAHAHRLAVAGQVIRSIRIVIRASPESEPETVRAHVSVTDGVGANYRPFVEVMGDEESRAHLLTQAMRDLDTMRKRYRMLSELAVVFAAVEKVKMRTRRRAA